MFYVMATGGVRGIGLRMFGNFEDARQWRRSYEALTMEFAIVIDAVSLLLAN
jgi:hypothetical protein